MYSSNQDGIVSLFRFLLDHLLFVTCTAEKTNSKKMCLKGIFQALFGENEIIIFKLTSLILRSDILLYS